MAKPSLERLGQEIETFLLGPRRERSAGLLNDAAEMLKDADAPPQPVPGRILMPILEYGSWEDEPDMQSKWAALDNLLKDGVFLASGEAGRREFEHIATDLLRLRVIDGVRWLGPTTDAQLNREGEAPEQVYRMTSTTDFERFHLTSLGIAFVKACTPPQKLR